MKDFYDIWLLYHQFEFDSRQLREAIKLTFLRRDTDIPSVVTAFQKEYIQAKQVQWAAYHKRIKQDSIPESFQDIVKDIDDFLSPIIHSIVTKSAK